MNPEVSIIMPCYNSEATLSEAVDSVLSHPFKGSLELIAVDDCSTDRTLQILREKADHDSRLKVIRHEENRGGGAARNTGIGYAHGDAILVFDSDDVLGVRAVEPMLELLNARSDLDGALFEEQRTFRGKDKDHCSPFRYYEEHAPIELRAVFQGQKALIGNFMFRRSAFEKAGGYPEHHGFDTQAFCMRFLSSGLRAQVAPGSFFWHRVSGPTASYFDRVFASGRFNLNTYLIYEDMIEQFSNEALTVIMNANVFRVSGFSSEGSEGIAGQLQSLQRSGVEVLRNEDADDLDVRSRSFIHGVIALRNEDYANAIRQFSDSARTGLSSPILAFNLVRCTLGLAGTEKARGIDAALAAVEQLRVRKMPSTRGWSLLDRALVKAARVILSKHGIEDPVS
jgi:glycosyltransferase involved in cell wall biosynthesis